MIHQHSINMKQVQFNLILAFVHPNKYISMADWQSSNRSRLNIYKYGSHPTTALQQARRQRQVQNSRKRCKSTDYKSSGSSLLPSATNHQLTKDNLVALHQTFWKWNVFNIILFILFLKINRVIRLIKRNILEYKRVQEYNTMHTTYVKLTSCAPRIQLEEHTNASTIEGLRELR